MGTGGVVGDGVGEPVVLIAEARRNPGDITQRGAAGRTGHDRDTGSRRQERCPRSRRRPIHRHAVDINGRRSVAPPTHERNGVDAGGEGPTRIDPQRPRRRRPGQPFPNRAGIDCAKHRCRLHQDNGAPVGERIDPGEQEGGSIVDIATHTRPAFGERRSLRLAARRTTAQLRQERRIPDDEIESLRCEGIIDQMVADPHRVERNVATRPQRECRSSRGDGERIDVDTMKTSDDVERCARHPFGHRQEKRSPADSRVEHGRLLVQRLGVDEGTIEDLIDDPGWRVMHPGVVSLTVGGQRLSDEAGKPRPPRAFERGRHSCVDIDRCWNDGVVESELDVDAPRCGDSSNDGSDRASGIGSARLGPAGDKVGDDGIRRRQDPTRSDRPGGYRWRTSRRSASHNRCASGAA